MSVKH